VVHAQDGVTASCLSAFHIDIAAMLEEKALLESLSFQNSGYRIKAEEYNALVVTVLQHKTTLKTLGICYNGSLRLTDDQQDVGI
jgi:hypothetical protein